MPKIEYNDYPIPECQKTADEMIAKGMTIFQKFTCQHCGSRQTMDVPNTFFSKGTCEECKKETNIEKRGCNYMAVGKAVAEHMAKMKRAH